MGHILPYFIYFILAVVAGMVLAIFVKPILQYHGPNSNYEKQKIYYHKKSGKCIQFQVLPIDCPRNPLNKLVQKFRKIV